MQEQMLDKLNKAFCDVQETVKANEGLRGENQALIAELQALRAKGQFEEEKNFANEQKVSELTKRNLLIETEN